MFIIGDSKTKAEFNEVNKKLIENGEKPAVGLPLLLGITGVHMTESFISAASFQETTRS